MNLFPVMKRGAQVSRYFPVPVKAEYCQSCGLMNELIM